MTVPSIPPWQTINTHLTLYHGCLKRRAASIRTRVLTRRGSPETDFGCGFYTTTRRQQAEEWAKLVYLDEYSLGKSPDEPAVVKFVVPLAELASLNSLAFVQGDSTGETFWSFVIHCRAGNSHAHPVRIPPEDWYDMVVGPVASWPQKPGSPLYSKGTYNNTDWEAYDQYSFHTDAATQVLNSLDRSNPAQFEILTVTP